MGYISMVILQKTNFYLNKIINNEESFTVILNRSLVNVKMSSNEVQFIKDALKAVVNKYYFVRYEVITALKEKEMTFNENEINVAVLCTSIFQYVKNVSKDEVLDALHNEFDCFNFEHSYEEVENIIRNIPDKPLELSEKINSIIVKKLALTYSYPEWVIKMMFKHFGVKDTYKSVASSRKAHPIVINTNPMKVDALTLTSDLFVKTNLTTTAYSYNGKDKIINLKEFKEGKIFVEDETSQLLVETMDPKPGDDILFVGDTNGLLPLDTCLRCNDFCNIKVASKNSLALHSINNMIRNFEISSIEAFESDAKLLITHVEPRKMDKVVVLPPSSSLGNVRRHPDILLALKRDSLDGLIENQRYMLNECERFVKDNGEILYAVYTMNKKEGQNIITEFMNEHTNYILVEDRQVFPYEGPSDGVYFAKLKKIG